MGGVLDKMVEEEMRVWCGWWMEMLQNWQLWEGAGVGVDIFASVGIGKGWGWG